MRECRAQGTQKQDSGSRLKNSEVRGWLRLPWRPSEERGREWEAPALPAFGTRMEKFHGGRGAKWMVGKVSELEPYLQQGH